MRGRLTFQCIFFVQLKKICQMCISLTWLKKVRNGKIHGKRIGQDSILLKNPSSSLAKCIQRLKKVYILWPTDFTSRNLQWQYKGCRQLFTYMNVHCRLVLLKNWKQSMRWTKEELVNVMQWLANWSQPAGCF